MKTKKKEKQIKITHVHILSILLPQTTYAHLEYSINIYIFVVSYLFIYAHWRAKLMSCTHLHLFEKELSCHLSTLERQFHIIYSFGKHSRAIFDMGTFFERLLMLPIHKYTYFERHFYATYPTYTDFWKWSLFFFLDEKINFINTVPRLPFQLQDIEITINEFS